VFVAVTPIAGDPDLFIGVAPLTHPSRGNYTWFQSKFGADSVTLQVCDIHICDYLIKPLPNTVS
jgi:hypothetical protein